MNWISTFQKQQPILKRYTFYRQIGSHLLRVPLDILQIWQTSPTGVFLFAIPLLLALLLTLLDAFHPINSVWVFLMLLIFGALCGWIGNRLNYLFHPELLTLEQVTKIYRSISKASNQEVLLDRMTEIVAGVLQSEHFSIWRYQHQDRSLTLLRFASTIAQVNVAEIPLDIEEKQLSNTKLVAALPESDLRRGLAAVGVQIAIPLTLGDEFVGILGLDKASYDLNDHRPGLELITGQLALVVKNSCLISDLQDTVDKLQLAYRRAIDVEEDERRRLAIEIHDDILSRLTSMAISLQTSQHHTDADPLAGHGLQIMREEFNYLQARLREITQGLHPTILTDLGLIPALQAYLDSRAKQPQLNPTACTITLTAQGFNGTRLTKPEMERDLYYIARQALDNALTHAQAEQIFIHLRWRKEAINITVQDTGCGMQETPQILMGQNGHLGLLSMRERAMAWSGRLTFYSQPAQGTTVQAHLPINYPSSEPTHLQSFTRQLTGDF